MSTVVFDEGILDVKECMKMDESFWKVWAHSSGSMLQPTCPKPGGGIQFASALMAAGKVVDKTPRSYRPMIVMVTDGMSSDSDCSLACASVAQLRKKTANSLLFYGICIGRATQHLERIVSAGNGGKQGICLDCGDIQESIQLFNGIDKAHVESKGLTSAFETVSVVFQSSLQDRRGKLCKVEEEVQKVKSYRQGLLREQKIEAEREIERLQSEVDRLGRSLQSGSDCREDLTKEYERNVDAANQELASEQEMLNKAHEHMAELKAQHQNLEAKLKGARADAKQMKYPEEMVNARRKDLNDNLKKGFEQAKEEMNDVLNIERKMIDQLGTKSMCEARVLRKQLDVVSNGIAKVYREIAEKKVGLKTVLEAMKDVIKKLKDPKNTPLSLSLHDKVSLTENALDSSLDLQMLDGDKANFEKLLSWMYAHYLHCDEVPWDPKNEDCIYRDALECIRGAKLSFDQFFAKGLKEMSPLDRKKEEERIKKAKAQALKKKEPYEPPPPAVPANEIFGRVESNIANMVRKRFGEKTAHVAELRALLETYGPTGAERTEKLRELLQGHKEEVAELKSDMKDLEKERKNEKDVDERADLDVRIKEAKAEIVEFEKEFKLKQKADLDRMKELESLVDIDEFSYYESSLSRYISDIIQDLSLTILAPYDSFELQFQKTAVKRDLCLGHSTFFLVVQQHMYLMDNITKGLEDVKGCASISDGPCKVKQFSVPASPLQLVV